MKALKIGGIVTGGALLILYLVFLFVLPFVVKFDKYDYKDANTGFVIKVEDIRLSTGWNLALGARVGQINAYLKSGEKFVQLDNLDVKLSVPHLLFKQIKLDKVSCDDIIARLGIEKDGKFVLEKNLPKTQNNAPMELPMGLTFSSNMPNISAKKYSLTFIDIPSSEKYSIKGTNFRISDFDLTKKIKIEGVGEIFLQDRKQFAYDVQLSSRVMPDFMALSNAPKKEEAPINIVDIFRKIYKLHLTASIKTDLKLSGSMDDLKTDGTINVGHLAVEVNGKQLPKSDIELAFSGNKATINSNIFTATDEKATAIGSIKYGKKPYIDMQVKSDKIDLSNLFSIVNSLLALTGGKDINSISANGILKADFNVKSNFKTINSKGYLKIENANIFYKIFNIALRDINSDIDFSSNQIEIKKASANLNGAPLSLKGAINSNAYANLEIMADDIPIKGILAMLGQVQILKENDIKSGNLTLNAAIKGNLNKATPQLDISVNNLNLRNKPNNINVKLATAKAKASTVGNKAKGGVIISGLKIYLTGLPMLAVPNSKIIFDEKDINFDDVYLMLNNSKIDILGKITDYSNKKIKIDLTAKGLLFANDIKSSLDRKMQSSVSSSGKLPLVVKITGNDKVQDIQGQVLANSSNYISIVDINSLSGKTSLINFAMRMTDNILKISDMSINLLNTNQGLSGDFKSNMSNSSKVIGINGAVDLSSKTPYIQGIKIDIPNQVAISIPGYKNSSLLAKGNVGINGFVTNPEITGYINIPSVSIPTMMIKGQNIGVNFAKTAIDVNCSQLNVANSAMSFLTSISTNFNRGIRIKSLDLNAVNLDVDSLAVALANMPQNANAPGTDVGITLSNGKAKVSKISTGNIVATNIFSDIAINNNVLKLSNITGNAFNGKIAGDIDYNILYSKTHINLQGRGLNSASAIYATTGMKNVMQGLLDFDAINLSTVGMTDKQIMQSLRGNATFIVSNGQMGTLGKLENLLYAQNILSNNILKTTLGAIAGAVSIKKTGDFKYIKGKLNFANGWLNIDSVQTSGPAMSMYITGRVNLLNNNANLIILGRLSNDVVSLLGPIGNFSVNKLIASIPRIGAVTSALINQMTTNPDRENLAMLPDLSPRQIGDTKEFKVSLNGGLENRNSITYFKWLAMPSAASPATSYPSLRISPQDVKQQLQNSAQDALRKIINIPVTQQPVQQRTAPNKQSGVADFINGLPDLMNR